MKKILLTVIILGGMTTGSFAQTTASGAFLSIGPEIGLPSGLDNYAYSWISGESVKFEMPLKPSSLFLTFTGGYDNFIVKGIYKDTIRNAGYVPLEIGLKYYLDPNVYVEGDAGVSFNVTSGYSGQRAAFIYAPAFGITVPIGARQGLDFAVRYEGRKESGGTVGQVALRVAYRFGW